MSDAPNPFDLSNRTALVTGATSGIGLAIAQGLAQAGATVFLNGRNRPAVEDAAVSVAATARPLAFDVTDEKAVDAAFREIGTLDILVNNVGVRNRKALDDFSLAEFRTLLDANLIAAFDLSRRAATLMKPEGRGRIINVTSIAGHIARAGDALYTASKAGLTGLTRAMSAELGPNGITVNAIAPGYVATQANADMVADPKITEFLKARTALGRWATPDELAGAAVFLASDAASYVTGHVLTVDGGFTAHF